MTTKRRAPDCSICDSNNWTDDTHQAVLTYKNNDFTVTGLMHSKCVDCGYALVLPHQARRNDALFMDARRKARGLLTSSQIKAVRKSLGFTQQQAAELIGCGKNAFSKYERCEVTQSAAMDKLLRVLAALPNAQEVLERSARSYSKRTPVYESESQHSFELTYTSRSFVSCSEKKRIRPYRRAA